MPVTPVYQRVIDDIKSKIASGEWPADHKLDSPVVLAEHYRVTWKIGVSPQSVRRATDTLQALGVLYGRQGVGVFVSESPPSVSTD